MNWENQSESECASGMDAALEAEKTQLPPVRSEPLLAAAFAEFWHAKWPHQTRDVAKLEKSLHYTHCREAFYAGAQAANKGIDRKDGAQ